MIFGEAYTFYLQCKAIDGFDELQLIVYEYICSMFSQISKAISVSWTFLYS